jgi:hypothetical protein
MTIGFVYKNGDATTALDPAVWGPHYWFVLFSMALTYPERPNDVTIKNTTTSFKICRCFCPTIKSATHLPNY